MAAIDGKWLSKEGLTYFWSKIKAIFTKQTETNVIANLGAKNLLLVTGTTSTVNSVAYTVNEDGTVTANGQASSNADWNINSSLHLEPGTYKLTGCPAGGNNSSTYRLQIQGIGYDTGTGLTFTVNSARNVNVHIRVWSGYNASDLVFKPMIRPVEITDDNFEPYAPSNRELYEEKNKLQASLDQITGIGQQIPSDADLNTYYNPGVYRILTTAIAQTIANIPSDCKVAGSIEVKTLNGSARMQFYYPNWASSGTNPGSFYFRQRTGATNWSAWYYFLGTQAASTQSAPASLMQAGAIDASLSDVGIDESEVQTMVETSEE